MLNLISIISPGQNRDYAGNLLSSLISPRGSMRQTLELFHPGSQFDGTREFCPTLEAQRSHWSPALWVL